MLQSKLSKKTNKVVIISAEFPKCDFCSQKVTQIPAIFCPTTRKIRHRSCFIRASKDGLVNHGVWVDNHYDYAVESFDIKNVEAINA